MWLHALQNSWYFQYDLITGTVLSSANINIRKFLTATTCGPFKITNEMTGHQHINTASANAGVVEALALKKP